MNKLIASTIVILVCCSATDAQLNFYAGYRLGFTSPDNFNAIVTQHDSLVNEDPLIEYRDTLGFGELRYLNGVDLGLSYAFPGGRVQFGWMNKRKQLRSEGARLGGNSSGSFENRITTTINNLNFGYYPTFWTCLHRSNRRLQLSEDQIGL